MSRTVWKFELEPSDEGTQVLVRYGHPVSAGLDPNGAPCVWIELDPDSKDEPDLFTFYVHGTGHPIPEDTRKFLGSMTDWPHVWHVFYTHQEPALSHAEWSKRGRS